jgi:hypothetical protein
LFGRFQRHSVDPVEVAARELMEQRLIEVANRADEMTRPPANGWREIAAFDSFAVDLVEIASPLKHLLGKREEKLIVVLRRPLDDLEPRLPVVVADSFKATTVFHQRALDLDTHVYVPGRADGGPTKKPSLIDCSKTYLVPRGLLERRSNSRDNFVASFETFREQIAIACSYSNGMADVFDLTQLVRRNLDQPSS